MSAPGNNIPFVILGAAILWFGFNGGSALRADYVAINGLVVTNLSASASAVSWMLVDWVWKGKPPAVGISLGAVARMVAITPATGYVGPSASLLIGVGAGIASNLVSNWRARTHLDDSLDVFACHGMGAIWGMIATGIFASVAINPAGNNGLINGNLGLVGVQMLGVTVVAGFAFFGSFGLLKLINVFTPVRVSPAEEEAGLDLSQHGEEAYA